MKAVFLPLVFAAACAAPTLSSPRVEVAAEPPATPASAKPTVAVPAAPSEADAQVPIRANNPTWGARTAPVTLVEFSDFQCPFCGRAQVTLGRLRETYGPQVLRVVWKNKPLPFHEQARPTAEAAAGVLARNGTAAFWRFHDAVFRHQGALAVEGWESSAREAGGIDVDGIRAAVAARSWTDAIDEDLREADALGVEGTPTFFINGVAIVGAQEFEAFRKVVDEQVRAARTKRDAGIPAELVYTELTRENRAKAAQSARDDAGADDSKTVYQVPVGHSPVLGSPNALVTIVEFSDFQCPFCERVESTLKSVREKYADKVRLVWKNEPLPFHRSAEPAAEAALEVRAEKGDGAFWRMHDALFANQQDLSEESLVQLAVDAGARAAAVKKAIDERVHAKQIEADADLADDFAANGTPYFFVNGRRLAGAQPASVFESLIDEEIEHAKGLLSAGTKPGDLYAALLRGGQGAPAPETRDVPASLPSNQPSRGPAAARVTIHQFSDFQCPYCQRVEGTLAQLTSDYGTRVRFVWHDLPLAMHRDAALAAQAGREAFRQKGDNGFWTLHDKLFSHARELGRAQLDGYASELGLDMDQWRSALDAGTHAAEIAADAKAAAEADIEGTPGFLVVPRGKRSAYFLGGAQPYAKFRKVVERALAEAK